jgi:hypothetical protein
MREGLETADSSLSNLEVKTSIIEERLQEIDEILKEIEASISQADARGDPEISASLQKNLSQKQVEYEQQAEAKKQISLQLNQIGAEIGQLQAQNNRSREEVAQLDALGENVSDGTALIQERQGMLQSLEQRYQNLLARLDQVSSLKISEAQSEWKVPGFVDVPVSDLPDPEGVNGPADFDHHISWENAKSAALLLPNIQQEIASGKTGDDLAQEDLAAGLDWEHGRKRVYDLFYSTNEPVRLEKNGNTYSITSGRHRVYVAKVVGLHTIPAQVIETT